MPETQSFQNQIHNVQNFDCANASLSEYIQKYASQDQKRGYAKVFVLVDPMTNVVLGYYTLSAYGVEKEQAGTFTKSLVYPQAPAVLLGRLAVDRSEQGKKYGARLLIDAIERYLSIRGHLGCTGIIVDAIDANATAFYAHFGFKVIPGTQDRMVLSDKAIVTLARSWQLQAKSVI